jgi:oligo-1,6-glucosidase/alpha-glucosidase
LLDFKAAISSSQTMYNEMGWGALYLENHDQPRSLNKFIKEEDIGPIPAKMLAAVYFLLKGTPFIYQGQEIGMTNVAYPSIEEYDDLASIDQYHAALRDGYSEAEALAAIWRRSRDNARTPMQWSDSGQAGFTNGEPWLKVNRNYSSVNVEEALQAKDSLYYFYKQLIQLRKQSQYSDVIVFGAYRALLEDHPQIIAYTREWEHKQIVVIANFGGTEVDVSLEHTVNHILLTNYENAPASMNDYTLRPYECIVYEVEQAN